MLGLDEYYFVIMNNKSFLQQQAYDYIKDRILSGEFLPNTLYSETKVSAEIGISRTPTREALQCLSQDGYITIIPSKGFMLRQISEKDMIDSIQVRCSIEGFCSYTAASEIHTPEGQAFLLNLEALLDKMRYALNVDNDIEAFIDYDHQFHYMMVDYIHNDEFNQIFQRLLFLFRLTSENALLNEGRAKETLMEHEKIFEALKAGDPSEAYRCTIKHLIMPLNLSQGRKVKPVAVS